MMPVKRLISSQGTEGIVIHTKRGTFAASKKKDDDNLITTCQSLSGQWPTFAAQNGGEDVKTREKVSSRCTRLNFSLER